MKVIKALLDLYIQGSTNIMQIILSPDKMFGLGSMPIPGAKHNSELVA